MSRQLRLRYPLSSRNIERPWPLRAAEWLDIAILGHVAQWPRGRIVLTIPAQFALHAASRLLLQALKQLRQVAEIREAEVGPSGGHLYERIPALHIRPTRRKLLQAAVPVVEVDPLLSPRLAVGLQPERPPVPRVERVGNAEYYILMLPISCS